MKGLLKLFLLLVVLFPTKTQCQILMELDYTWEPDIFSNDRVNTIAYDEDNEWVYYGGYFHNIQIRNPYFSILDTNFSVQKKLAPRLSEDDSQYTIRSIENDGSGGWYIGASANARFDEFIHIDGSGSLINDGPNFNNSVDLIKTYGSYVLASGYFNKADGMDIGSLAIMQSDTDSLLSIGPRISEIPSDFTLLDSLLVLAGDLGFEGEWNKWGTPVNIYTREITRSPYDIFNVEKVIGDGNGGWFLGGESMNLDDSLRNGLAQIDENGIVTSFNHDVHGTVTDMFLQNDTLYFIGEFSSVDAQTRHNIAAISLVTDSLTPLDTQFNSPLNKIYVTNDSIVVNGNFGVVGDNSYGFGEVELNDFSNEHYFFELGSNQMPNSIPIPGGGMYLFDQNENFWNGTYSENLPLGNSFGSYRDRSAHLNPAGDLTSWECEVDFSNSDFSEINDYAFYEDALIIVGRGELEGQTVSGILAFNRTTGEHLENYFPEEFSINLTTEIELSGDYIITHEWDSNLSTDILQAYSLVDQSITVFDDLPNGNIQDVAIGEGILNVLGDFQSFQNGDTAYHFAQYSMETFENLYSNVVLSYGDIESVLAWGGNVYFIDSNLDSINYTPRGWFAAINEQTGTLLNIEFPEYNLNNFSKPYIDEHYLYVDVEDVDHFRVNLLTNEIDTSWGEEFYNLKRALGQRASVNKYPMEGELRQRFCSLNKDGELLDWDPAPPFGDYEEIRQLGSYTYYLKKNTNNDLIYRSEHSSGEFELFIELQTSILSMDISGSGLLVTGLFDEINGDERIGIAEFDAVTGELTDKVFIDPDIFQETWVRVNSMSSKGDTLFLAGSFPINSDDALLEAGNYEVLAFDLNSGDLLDWHLDIEFSPDGFSSNVEAIVQDSIVYIQNASIGLNPLGNLEVYNLNTQSFEEHFLPDLTGEEDRVLVDSKDGILYLHGEFDSQFQIKAFDISNNYSELWSQSANADQMFIYGDTLILTSINWIVNDQYRWLAGIDINTGEFLPWDPMGGESFITSANLYRASLFENSLVLAGRFWTDDSFENLLTLSLDSNELRPSGARIDFISTSSLVPKINALAHNNSGVALSGDFRASGGVEAHNFAIEDLNDQSVVDLFYDFDNSEVNSIILYGDSMYISGSFTEVNGLQRNRFFSAHKVSGEISNWNPFEGINTGTPLLGLVGDNLLISTHVGDAFGDLRDKAAMIDLSNHELLSFDTDVEATTYAVAGNRLFLGGLFTEAEGQPREGIAAYSLETGELLDWEVNGLIVQPIVSLHLEANDTTLFVREVLTEESGQARRLAAVDPISGDVFPWFYEQALYSSYGDIELWNDKIIVGSNNNFRIQSIPENVTFPWNEYNRSVRKMLATDSLIFVNGTIFKTDFCEMELNCVDTVVYAGESGVVLAHADMATASSPCEFETQISENTEFFNCTELGAHDILVTATDSEGQARTCVASIQIIDTLPPIIACSDIEASLLSDGTLDTDLSQVFLGSLGSCNVFSYEISAEQSQFTCDDIGQEFDVTVEVSDGSGNSSSCVGTVSISLNDTDFDGVDEYCDICYGDDASGDDDGDGICNNMEVQGCLNPSASNYNPFATDPGLCSYEYTPIPDTLSADTVDGDGSGRPLSFESIKNASFWEFQLYPNPTNTSDNFHIQIDSELDELVSLRFYDASGSALAVNKVQLKPGRTNQLIHLDNSLSPGIYVVSLTSSHGVKFRKLIIL